MDSKTCTKCGIPKPTEKFKVDKRRLYGRGSWCRSCQALVDALYRKANPKKIKETGQRWYKEHKAIKNKRGRLSYKMNQKAEQMRSRLWRKANPAKHATANAAWSKANREKINRDVRLRREMNPEKARIRNRRSNIKKLSSAHGKLSSNISRSIHKSLHKNKANCHWEGLVGFNLDQLKRHIEKQFTVGMSWDRYMKGEIHLDHKIPIAAFHFETPEDIDFKKCWCLKNLRPMWALENIKKGAKVERPFQPSLLLSWPATPEKQIGAGPPRRI